ncbi:hypothetical protein DXG01_014757, partial [Tephrocybe rancida]
MQLLSFLLATALLFSQIVVGTRTINTRTATPAADAAALATVTVMAEYRYELIFSVDNTKNTAGSYTSQTFNKAVETEAHSSNISTHVGIQTGVAYGPVSVKAEGGVTVNNEASSILERTTTVQEDKAYYYNSTETQS